MIYMSTFLYSLDTLYFNYIITQFINKCSLFYCKLILKQWDQCNPICKYLLISIILIWSTF